jgi:hypothetical protein
VCVYHATLGFNFYRPYEVKNCLMGKKLNCFESWFWDNQLYMYVISWLLEFILVFEIPYNRGYRIAKLGLAKQKNTGGVNIVFFRTTGIVLHNTFLFLCASVVLNVLVLF